MTFQLQTIYLFRRWIYSGQIYDVADTCHSHSDSRRLPHEGLVLLPLFGIPSNSQGLLKSNGDDAVTCCYACASTWLPISPSCLRARHLNVGFKCTCMYKTHPRVSLFNQFQNHFCDLSPSCTVQQIFPCDQSSQGSIVHFVRVFNLCQDGSLEYVEPELCPVCGWTSVTEGVQGYSEEPVPRRTEIQRCRLFAKRSTELGCFRQAGHPPCKCTEWILCILAVYWSLLCMDTLHSEPSAISC